MSTEKALAATEAIRQMLDKYPFGFKPKPAARQDAEKELNIIRENSPKSCEGKIVSLSTWLDMLFIPESHEKHGLRKAPKRVKEIQSFARNELSRIEAEVKKSAGVK
jgi:hypothetical protein